jgi:hypothetical protein
VLPLAANISLLIFAGHVSFVSPTLLSLMSYHLFYTLGLRTEVLEHVHFNSCAFMLNVSHRLCIGRHAAVNNLFITIACMLWALSITPVTDEKTGQPVLPDKSKTGDPGLVMYVDYNDLVLLYPDGEIGYHFHSNVCSRPDSRRQRLSLHRRRRCVCET